MGEFFRVVVRYDRKGIYLGMICADDYEKMRKKIKRKGAVEVNI